MSLNDGFKSIIEGFKSIFNPTSQYDGTSLYTKIRMPYDDSDFTKRIPDEK